MVWQKGLQKGLSRCKKRNQLEASRAIKDSHINCQPKLPKLIRCYNVGMAKCEFEFEILHEITLGQQTLHYPGKLGRLDTPMFILFQLKIFVALLQPGVM